MAATDLDLGSDWQRFTRSRPAVAEKLCVFRIPSKHDWFRRTARQDGDASWIHPLNRSRHFVTHRGWDRERGRDRGEGEQCKRDR